MAKIVYENYEEGSWDAWESILTAHRNRMSKDDLHAYLPSPREIEDRKVMLRWLQAHKFPRRFISAVMMFDHPGIELVRAMVAKHGAKETLKRLDPLLPETEYDGEDG